MACGDDRPCKFTQRPNVSSSACEMLAFAPRGLPAPVLAFLLLRNLSSLCGRQPATLRRRPSCRTEVEGPWQQVASLRGVWRISRAGALQRLKTRRRVRSHLQRCGCNWSGVWSPQGESVKLPRWFQCSQKWDPPTLTSRTLSWTSQWCASGAGLMPPSLWQESRELPPHVQGGPSA